jgi:hypothetical protein
LLGRANVADVALLPDQSVAEAVAGAVSVRVAVQSEIVTGLLSARFCECPRADPRQKVAPVNIAANHARIIWKASSIALQFFGVFPRLFSLFNGSIESKQSAE